ncbi:hypothetical protein M422DRAFT_775625 [Sphaerobolus stellatus SS14]|nr:hypothetical protein M422DRAFT_775625 [Sphaerobolus stellatus SS14]
MSIAIYFAWGESRRVKTLFRSKSQSLTTVFLRQDIIRFTILFIWALEVALGEKMFPPSLRGIDSAVQNAVSIILICRFTLELRKFCRSPQVVPSLNLETPPRASSGGRLQRLRETIIEEFGNSELYYDSNIEGDFEGYEPAPLSAQPGATETELRITAEEFPRAINSSRWHSLSSSRR